LLSSYILNKVYTFKSKAKPTKEIIKFVIVFIFSFGLNLLALMYMVSKLGTDELIAQILSGFVYTTSSYFLNKYFVFRNKSNYKLP